MEFHKREISVGGLITKGIPVQTPLSQSWVGIFKLSLEQSI